MVGRKLGTRVCATPGCPVLCQSSYCPAHTNEVRQGYKRNDYGSEWQRISRQFLLANRWCQCRDRNCGVCHGSHGQQLKVIATDVDHVIRLRDLPSRKIAHSKLNLQSLCKPCHSSKTIRKDRDRKLID